MTDINELDEQVRKAGSNSFAYKNDLIDVNHSDRPNEAESFLINNPEIKFIDLLISDLNGIIRGKRIEASSLTKVYQQGVNLPMSIFSMDILGETIEKCGLGLSLGEPDLVCMPIAQSLHRASWHNNDVAQLLMTMSEHDNKPFYADPRNVLNDACNRINQLNYTAVVAVELEFYLFDKNRDLSGRIQAPISPKTGQRDKHTQVYSVDTLSEYGLFLDEISRVCMEQNVPADTAVAEYAPGQFEINLKHQADPLKACDNAILLKRIIKGVADNHNFDCSFMAKPYANEAGSGMHIHLSLLDEHGNNVFSDDKKEYSQLLEYAVGGLLELMPASMPFLCPNVNSYKRFQPDSYVAQALTWGVDNRTVALRIPKSDKKETRIEHRVSGADANPYLVMSIILNSIVHGLAYKIKPMKPITGDATKHQACLLPIKLTSAINALSNDSQLSQYLGQKFTEVYKIAKQYELDQFESHISELELQWYLRNV